MSVFVNPVFIIPGCTLDAVGIDTYKFPLLIDTGTLFPFNEYPVYTMPGEVDVAVGIFSNVPSAL